MSTSASSPGTRPARRPGPSPLTVITGTLGLFLVLLTLLALQVRSGRDPSLSKSAPAAVVAPGMPAAQAATKAVVTKTS